MPTTSNLISAAANACGVTAQAVEPYVFALREAGHIAPTKRGRGAPPATPLTAINIALALLLPGPAAIREPDPNYGASRFLAAAHLEMSLAAVSTYEVSNAIEALDLAQDERRFGAWLDGIMQTLVDDPARAFDIEGGLLTHLHVTLEDAGPVARITFQPSAAIANHEISFEFRQPAIPWNEGSLGIGKGEFGALAAAAHKAESASRVNSITLKAPLFESLAACFKPASDTS